MTRKPDARQLRGRLLVSDSHASGEPGPGIWAYDLASGEGGLWSDLPMNSANGLAMRPGEAALYVCETFDLAITRIPILADGVAGEAEPFASDLPGMPDGIAFDPQGNLIVGCYEPSRLLRIDPGGRTEVLLDDPTAHLLCHPTDVAVADGAIYTANLGRWHLTAVSY